jgi:Outer membrane protein beta-barrel domain
MKKALIILILIPTIAFSQEKASNWYIKAGTGYAFKGFLPQEYSLKMIMPSSISLDPAEGAVEDMVNRIDSTHQRSLVQDTYSKGFNFYLGGGYKFNKIWAIELGFLLLNGEDIHAKTAYRTHLLLGDHSSIQTRTKAIGLALTPALAANIPLSNTWYLQGRVGMTIPLMGLTSYHLDINAPNSLLGSSTAVIEAETESSFSLGFNGAFGIHKKIGNHLDIGLELNGQHLNLIGKHLNITKYELLSGGITTNMFTNFPGAYHSEIDFVSELNSTSNNTSSGVAIDHNKPREELQVTSPFSSIGVGIGISYLF